EGLDIGREAIGAAPLGVQVDELAGLPGVLGDRLQAHVLDKVGDEALLVLDLHGVEGAAVRVDADEEVGFFGEAVEGAVGHRLMLQLAGVTGCKVTRSSTY